MATVSKLSAKTAPDKDNFKRSTNNASCRKTKNHLGSQEHLLEIN